jgi:glucokinase
MFCEMLGTVAGDLALTLGAQGGVYIAGGIVPRLGVRFVESGFRARFETKGRLSSYLAAIPTYVVTHPLPAFLGCAAVLAGT